MMKQEMIISKMQFLRMQRALGWSGMLGLLCLVATLCVYLIAILPNQKAIAQHLVSIQHYPKTQPLKPGNVLDSVNNSDSSTTQVVPSVHDLPQNLSKLMRLIEQQQLVLIASEYKLDQRNSQDFIQYEIRLPLKGHYQDLRALMGRLTTELPYLGIKSLDLKRESITETTIEAQLTVVFYLQRVASGV